MRLSKNLHMTTSGMDQLRMHYLLWGQAMYMAELLLNLNVTVANSDDMVTVVRLEYGLSTIGFRYCEVASM